MAPTAEAEESIDDTGSSAEELKVRPRQSYGIMGQVTRTSNFTQCRYQPEFSTCMQASEQASKPATIDASSFTGAQLPSSDVVRQN